MGALQYLYVKTFKNRIKQLVKKPIAILYLIGIIAYAVWMFVVFQDLVVKMKINSGTGLATFLSVMALWTIPLSLTQFAKRKGLIFKKSDIHFLFVSPTSPKKLLLYGYGTSLIMSLIMIIVAIPIGIIWFHVPLYKMLIYVVVSQVIENALEMSIMVLLYGNERLSERTSKWIGKILLVFVLAVVAVGVYMYFDCNKGFSFISDYVSSSYLQIIPIIGWIIAIYHLLFVGATTVNVICTCLYIVTACVFVYMALRMRCTGEYYEDAMKFADDYEAAKLRSKKGEVGISENLKKKLKKATVSYKGHFAKAIFYRQLLEYKKKPLFIFGLTNLLYLGAGILAYFMANDPETGIKYLPYVIAGIIAYVSFIFNGLSTKWNKELENPLTFLIPDTAVKKLWYATAMEHIRAAINGVLIILPGLVLGKLGIVESLLLVVVTVCLNANKLYSTVLCDVILGTAIGMKGKQILRLVLMSLCIFLSGVATFIFGGSANVLAGVIGMILTLLVITGGIAVAASRMFNKMEM